VKIISNEDMLALGQRIGEKLRGGEILELIGDIGAGKTTFAKGLAQGLGIVDDVQSPSFTISRVYAARDDLILSHYDFYRLADAGIMKLEIAESLREPKTITVVEWGESVRDVLPSEKITVNIKYLPETGREINLKIPEKFSYLRDIIGR
jgi:tRNA threonylcarbamoyladenosine biosynthesis protein TsaE